MLKEVPCQFCQQSASYSPIEEMENMEVYAYWCEPCQAEYLYFKDSDHVNGWSLYTTINNRVYRWSVGKSGNAALIYLKKSELPRTRLEGYGAERLLLIAKGDSRPNITPQNIQHKIKIYLLFL